LLCRFSFYHALPYKRNRKDTVLLDPSSSRRSVLRTDLPQVKASGLRTGRRTRAYVNAGLHFLQRPGKISSATLSAGCR